MNLATISPSTITPGFNNASVTLSQPLDYRSVDEFNDASSALSAASSKLAASTGAEWTSTVSGPTKHGMFRKSFEGEFNVTFSGSMDAVAGAVTAWPNAAKAALDALEN